MPTRQGNSLTDLAMIAVFGALITTFSIVPAVNIPWSPVPITLQTLAVALAAMIIGPWRGCAATLLYLAVGFAGLPVFSGGQSGVGILARGSAGYLLSFPVYAIVVGLLARWFLSKGLKWAIPLLTLAGLVGSFLIVHPAGIVGMHLNIGFGWKAAILADLPFWPGDLVKTVFAAMIANAVHKAFPMLLVTKTAQPANA